MHGLQIAKIVKARTLTSLLRLFIFPELFGLSLTTTPTQRRQLSTLNIDLMQRRIEQAFNVHNQTNNGGAEHQKSWLAVSQLAPTNLVLPRL